MDITKRIFSICATPKEDKDDVNLLTSSFVSNLLLFENFIMLSNRLLEFPRIVSTFGYEPTIELLKSKCLKINCDPTQIVIWGSTPELVNQGKALTYEFVVIRSENHRDYLSSCFDNVRKNSSLSSKEKKKLIDAIFPLIDLTVRDKNLSNLPEFIAAKNFIAELARNDSSIKKAVILELNEKHKITNISNKDFEIKLHQVGSDIFKAETNLQKIYGFNEYDCHEIIQNALFKIVGINQGFAYMDKYQAISELNENDILLLEEKLKFYAKNVRADNYTKQFERILKLKDFPDFDALAERGELRLDKILELRESKEIEEFRNWLPSISSATDNEVKEQIESISTKIGNFLPTKRGKTLRMLVNSGIGIISGNPLTSLLSSGFNTFVLEKLLPSSGPISFINNKLPSVIHNKKNKPNSYERIFDI